MGRVTLNIGIARQYRGEHPVLMRGGEIVRFAVTDTGIGIPADKHKIIFEAFQQVDMTTSRKYGGTGLGLSISREIASMLGGEIRLHSAPGKGSTFSLYLPVDYIPFKRSSREDDAPPVEHTAQPDTVQPLIAPNAGGRSLSEYERRIDDDRTQIHEGDRPLLVVEDDEASARIMLDLSRRSGLKTLVACRGDE